MYVYDDDDDDDDGVYLILVQGAGGVYLHEGNHGYKKFLLGV